MAKKPSSHPQYHQLSLADEPDGQRGPVHLMRCAEAFASFAVEVFIEDESILAPFTAPPPQK
ncbi:MAG: hypothetical protein EAZ42_10915 [Verrucomicrobia bacterium]|nr:MAG: hypothetical protein EAZ42_10915 [Verrucomicrobiota bacterium]